MATTLPSSRYEGFLSGSGSAGHPRGPRRVSDQYRKYRCMMPSGECLNIRKICVIVQGFCPRSHWERASVRLQVVNPASRRIFDAAVGSKSLVVAPAGCEPHAVGSYERRSKASRRMAGTRFQHEIERLSRFDPHWRSKILGLSSRPHWPVRGESSFRFELEPVGCLFHCALGAAYGRQS
jgi:hypothetical protein